MTPLRSSRKVVIVLQGGLGNQLFQFCAGEAVQKRSGYRVFYDCEVGFRGDVSGRRFELTNLIPPERRAPPTPSSRAWRNSFQERLAVTVEQQWMFRRGTCSLPLRATLQVLRWWPASELVLRSCFQSLDFVTTDTVERIRGAIGAPRGGSSSDVAVHFRLARHLDRHCRPMRDHSETVLSLDYYRNALRNVRTELPGALFRVFSDAGSIPENVFDPGDRVLLDDPLQDQSPSHTLSRMSGCGHFVIANSTFSWWAAVLGQARGKRVYAPRDWRFHNDAPPQQGIFPKDWRRV